MMHFSISESEECKDQSGAYTLYKIDINGAHHCSVRFSQLHNLHKQLKKEFGAIIPEFPPKKILQLSARETEERRYQLEKYLQQISQNTRILASDLFTNFFLSAQKETQKEPEAEVEISVYLMNFEKVNVSIKSYDQTEDLLEKVMEKISLNLDYAYYFGIFLVKKDDEETIKIIRKLQDFESPFISLKAANKLEKHRLLLRKSILDPSFENDLLNDDVAVNLLYIQALTELERGWVIADASVTKQLRALEEKNSKREFLRLISTQKYYGYLQFKQCITNYPENNTNVKIAIGNKTISFRTQNGNAETEINFKVTRIRCWRIYGGNEVEADGRIVARLELSFEYLFSKNNLIWITVSSDQAILISMTLQSMVDEIIMKKEGKRMKRFTDRHKLKSTPFLTRQKNLINANAASSASGHRNSTSSASSGTQSEYLTKINGAARDFTNNNLYEDEITNDDL